MDIEFIKMQSCGNDYILLDGFKNEAPNDRLIPDLAAQIAGHRFGVGAQGLVLLRPSTRTDLQALCLDTDGAAMGSRLSALRCAGRYAFDAGLVKNENFTIDSSGTPEADLPAAGASDPADKESIATLEIIDSRNLTVSCGPPYYWDRKQELREQAEEDYTHELLIEGRSLSFTPVFLDKAHLVLFLPDLQDDLQKLADQLADVQPIKHSVPIDFTSVYSREALRVLTWVSGQGQVMANDHSACAAVVAAVLNGFSERAVKVYLESGNLLVDWSEKNNQLFTSGPADYVFTGTYYYDEGDRPSGS